MGAPLRAVDLSSDEQELYDIFRNASGQQRPESKIYVDPILESVARSRAKDMAERDYFSHVNPDGNGPNYLVTQAGYRLPGWWGDDRKANYIESIGGGHPTAKDVWNGWMDSSSHKRHLLAADSFYRDQTAVGIGHFHDSDSRYGHYWVVLTAPATPRVRITSPAQLTRVDVPEIDIAGTASQKPAAVEYEVVNESGTSAVAPATGASDWTAHVSGLVLGRNKIIVRSRSAKGEVMARDAVTVKYVRYSTLTIGVTGNGTIRGAAPGAITRRVGSKIVLKAIPAAGWEFVGWTGSVEVSTKRIKTRMIDDMTLTAVFQPVPVAF